MDKVDGYISKILAPDGKVYALRCEIVEVYATTCPKYGGNVTLKYGTGKCDFCGTSYTTQFKMVEGVGYGEESKTACNRDKGWRYPHIW